MDETVRLRVNGEQVELACGKDERLIDLLRERLGLTGTRFGCGEEMCGACMVLVDDRPAYACTFAATDAAGKDVITIEGLGSEAAPHALQSAFLELQAGQCGYCLSGIIVSAAALLKRNPAPSRAQIAEALDPHLCRCGAHHRILKAVEAAAHQIAASPA
ncbi:(2Fe-2S)-binding protein [Mesorhizobium sp. CAU 1741]|uniref:(2Fe-2S)-binding protein n=1 Tax=Mesorhizobium sp. CAU 1741 TaxID=3140366 RepID=UPI00325BA18E